MKDDLALPDRGGGGFGALFLAACQRGLTPPLKAELRGWAGLAVAALAAAGVLALLLAFARTPRLQDWLPWPWQDFFHKALITHVVYSIVVWYLAALGALATLATARVSVGMPRAAALGPVGLAVSAAGCVLLSIPALANWGEPSLNNYVPVLVHPLFYAGLILTLIGIALAGARLLLNLPGARVEPFDTAVAAGVVALLVAGVCFVVAYAVLPPGLDITTFNERLFWGGGHVLQFVNTLLMLAGWYVLAGLAFDEPPVGGRIFTVAVASLAVAALAAIPLYAFDILGREHRDAFTQLLWYGLSLQPAVVLVGGLALIGRRAAAAGGLPWRKPEFVGLSLSLALFAAGGVLGFFLGVADTRTPSHYHGVIGGVNLALMAIYFALFLPLLGRPARRRWAVLAQYHLYGFGQILFSVGMFAAGAAGVPRKTAGAEQGLDTALKVASMVVYGAGGLIAVVGGVMFVWMATARLLARGERR